MPASKRRRSAQARRLNPPAESVTPATPTAPTAKGKPVAHKRVPPSTDPDREARWTPLGLLVLLTLVFALQMPVGAVIHLTSHANQLVVDLFFFQPEFVLFAAVLMMPIARIVTHQPRALRFLESLSLGAVFALLALLLATVFVHPANGSVSNAAFVRSLTASDGLRIAFGDLLALFGTVAAFPGFNRLLGAPGRRARRRMIERNAAAPRAGATRGRTGKGTGTPRRRP